MKKKERIEIKGIRLNMKEISNLRSSPWIFVAMKEMIDKMQLAFHKA